MSVPILTTFAIYLAGMLTLGFVAYRATRNLPDYILGGRRLSGAVAALSAGASDMSGWLLLGLPGAVYAAGLNQVWIAVGLTIGAYLNWQFVAARLRRYTELARDSLTLPDFLENRFHDETHLLRVCSALVILFFFTVYTSAGLVGGAILFERSFGLTYHSALGVGTLVIVSYTFLGGFLAVSWTDFAQGILMFLALIVTPAVAVAHLDGWTETLSLVSSTGPGYLDAFSDMTLLGIVSLMAWGLGYFGQPHILARFMAVRSSEEVPLAQLVGMGWMVLSLYGAVFVGFVAIGAFADAPLINPETAFIALTQTLFNPWIAGCLLAAILAAIMSTVDSQLLVSASALTQDFYKALFRTGASSVELLWISRTSVVVVALAAVYIARDPENTVLGLVAHAWAGFGAGFGPSVILSLLWARTTRNGALAGMITGAITVVTWAQLEGGIFDVYEILPGFLAGGCAVILGSLLDKAPSMEIRDEFSRV
jgi:sodium/proline symporter